MAGEIKPESISIAEIMKWLIGLLQAALVMVAMQMTSEIKEATKSINELNVKIAVLVQTMANQQDRINELSARVTALERKQGR